MSLSGNFSSLSPSDLLQMLVWGSKTGLLTCLRNDDRRHLFISEGNVVGVSSSRYKDRLGAVLLRLGYVTEDQFDETFNQQASNGRQLGEIFMEHKLLTEEKLQSALHKQAEDSIFDLLAWSDGDFSFEERPLTNTEFKVKPITIANMLLEGARRIDEISRCKETFFDPDMVLVLAPEIDLDALELTRSQAVIARMLQKPWSLGDIFQMANESEFEIYAAIYRLYDSNLITEIEAATQQRKQENVKFENLLEISETMEKKGWFHESLSNVNKVLQKNPNHSEALEVKARLENEIIQSAQSVFHSLEQVPIVRRSVAMVSADKLCLNPVEGFVFFRIDGITSVKNLRYITGLPEKDLIIILHKFIRMGLIYLEQKPGKKRAAPFR